MHGVDVIERGSRNAVRYNRLPEDNQAVLKRHEENEKNRPIKADQADSLFTNATADLRPTEKPHSV